MKYFFLFIILFFSFQKKVHSENITTDFLIADPAMPDPRFKETVIVMLYHNKEEGAAGLVINKPLEMLAFSKLFRDNKLTPPESIEKKAIKLYWGGPVDHDHIFIVHTSDYRSNNFILSNKDFTITRSPEILLDIANNNGPKEFLILLGIAVWQPGQLDFEIKEGSWRKISSSYSLLFNIDDEIWVRLINSQDI